MDITNGYHAGKVLGNAGISLQGRTAPGSTPYAGDDDNVCFLESRGHRMPGSRITRSAVTFEIILAGLISMEQVPGFTLEVREQLAIMCCLWYGTALGILPAPLFQHAINGGHTCRV